MRIMYKASYDECEFDFLDTLISIMSKVEYFPLMNETFKVNQDFSEI